MDMRAKLVKTIDVFNNFDHVKDLLKINSKSLEIFHLKGDIQENPSPFHLAVHNGSINIIKILLEHGSNINAYCEYFESGILQSALHIAIKKGDSNVVNFLIDSGADPKRPSLIGKGSTPGSFKEYKLYPLNYAQSLLQRVTKQNEITELTKIVEKLKKSMPVNNKRVLAPLVSFSGHKNNYDSINTRVSNENLINNQLSNQRNLELKKALGLKRELDSKHKELIELNKKQELEIAQIKNKYKESRNNIEKIILEIKEDVCFKEVNEIERLMKSNQLNNSNQIICPICIAQPEKIFCCQTCDNMVCGQCLTKLNNCPMCREDFISKPPLRNKYAERLMNTNMDQDSIAHF